MSKLPGSYVFFSDKYDVICNVSDNEEPDLSFLSDKNEPITLEFKYSDVNLTEGEYGTVCVYKNPERNVKGIGVLGRDVF